MTSQSNASAPDIRYVDSTRVACDGDEGALGHPRVFMQMDASGETDCLYCDRHFILAGGPADVRTKAA
jgi:NADH dehydrogenase (ubiquinone) Fe-S protein 6